MNDVNIEHLLFLRTAKVKEVPAARLPVGAAEHLSQIGLAQPIGIGIEISDRGLKYLEAIFLFCAETGCDGILRRWQELTEDMRHDPQDPELGRPSSMSSQRYYIQCNECGLLNLLGKEKPRNRRQYGVHSIVK